MLDADARGRTALLARVDGRLPELRPAERRVAQLLLEQPARAIFTSVVELAELASTSSATVVRCAQRLGFGGFHELKAALAQALAGSGPPATRGGDALGPDPRLVALAQVTAAGAASVRDAGALVDPALFEASVAALDRAGRVLMIGVGSSAALCQDTASRFTAIGLHAEAPADVHYQHLRARLLRSGDACLVLSHTGSSRETLGAARAAVAGGASTLAITSYATSPLVALVDHALVVGTRALAPHLAPLATRLAPRPARLARRGGRAARRGAHAAGACAACGRAGRRAELKRPASTAIGSCRAVHAQEPQAGSGGRRLQVRRRA